MDEIQNLLDFTLQMQFTGQKIWILHCTCIELELQKDRPSSFKMRIYQSLFNNRMHQRIVKTLKICLRMVKLL